MLSQTSTTPKLTGLHAKLAIFLYSHTVFIQKGGMYSDAMTLTQAAEDDLV